MQTRAAKGNWKAGAYSFFGSVLAGLLGTVLAGVRTPVTLAEGLAAGGWPGR